MDTVLIAVSSVTLIGAVCAAVLSIANKLMYVAVDERITQIQDALPGTNCGACGFPGCSGYAVALVKDSAVKSNLCTPGGADVISKISAVLGVEGEAAVSKIAVVRCGGDNEAQQKKMDYQAIKTCYAAANFAYAGDGACAYGCFGYGDCKAVCAVNAICLENGLARVNTKLCNGCGMCVKACPNRIISMENGSLQTFVACSNIEKAAAVRKKCAKACLGCGLCGRKCPEQAIVIENNLAKIDYEKCTDCGTCAEVCPTKCVKVFQK